MTRTGARRWATRMGLAALSSLTLTAGALAVAGTAQAAPENPYAPSHNHPYRHGVVPTLETHAKMQEWAAQNAAGQASSSNLKYGGGVDGIGVTTGHEKVYLVFWGTQWGTSSTNGNGDLTFSSDTYGGAPKLQEMFKGLGTGGELWSGVMTQYCDGTSTGSQTCSSSNPHVAYPTGGALSGVWYDNASSEPSAASARQLGDEAVRAAGHFGNTTASSNRNAQYVILSAKGLNPDNYKTGGFCAWHDWNGDSYVGSPSSYGDIAFTNMPYVMDQGTSCGMNFVNSGTAGQTDGYTMVEGHEYAETITDQNPAGGWTDSSGSENADKCAWLSPGTQGGAANLTTSTGTFAEQGTWSNDYNSGSGGCEFTHAIVGGGGSSSVTVNNPGNQTGTVGVATSLTMTASGGTTPYTWSATGLPAGLSINSSTGVISGTPSTANTYNVTVTATDSASSSGSTSFTWAISSSGGGGCTGTGQKLGNPGFESGNTVWSASSGVIGQWGAYEPTHSGSWDAWMDGYGTTHTDTVSQSVTLPSGCSSYTLSFYLHIDTSEYTTTTAYDKMTVKIGSTTLATFSNLNAASGYKLHSYNLSAYAGSTVTLKFTGSEDVSLQTSFVLDDTAINVS